MNTLKIGVIGLGMVGTPLRRYFEEVRKHIRGESLFLYDIDPHKDCQDDINKADVIFVCVPTPALASGQAGLAAVEAAFKMISPGKAVVLKSTVPPGTTEYFQKKYPQLKVLFNPEFLTERRAWEDMVNPDRQVVAHTAQSKELASTVLNNLPTAFFSSPGTLGTYTFMRVNATEAELGKYAGNLFGALKVTYGNIIKDFCDSLGIALQKKKVTVSVDYKNVRAMLAHDRRIGDSWLDAEYHDYRGYGGYCFTKDTKALMKSGEELVKQLPKSSPERKRLTAGVALLKAMRTYNKTLLATQGLTEDDVSIHDHEWIKKRLAGRKDAKNTKVN